MLIFNGEIFWSLRYRHPGNLFQRNTPKKFRMDCAIPHSSKESVDTLGFDKQNLGKQM